MVDDADAVGEDVGLLQVLGRQEDRHALVVGEPRDLLPQRRTTLGVQPRRRLVEEQDPRRVDERERQIEPALHAAGVPADPPVGRFGEADSLEQLVGPSAALGGGQPLKRRLQQQVLTPREERDRAQLPGARLRSRRAPARPA